MQGSSIGGKGLGDRVRELCRDGSVEGAYDRLAIAVALLTEVATRSRAAKIEVVRRPHVLHGTAAEADGAAGTSWAADGVQLLKRRLRSRWVW